MGETDLSLGGGYVYQWECAIFLALNYFLDQPLRYHPDLHDLITSFLGDIEEIQLEGKDAEQAVELEDINLITGDRRILIQVKSKQAEGGRWTPSDPQFLKALSRFYTFQAEQTQARQTRYIFLTNRPFNPDLVEVKSYIEQGLPGNCAKAESLYRHLEHQLSAHNLPVIQRATFDAMLSSTLLVEFLSVEEVKANIQAKLQAFGREDIDAMHAILFEHFSRQSTRLGGGIVTKESLVDVLGEPLVPLAEVVAIKAQVETLTELVRGIKGLSVDYAGRTRNFLLEYLGTPDKPVPFGGRKQQLAALDDWLNDPQAEPYCLIAAGAGRGKSALLVRWADSLIQRDNVHVIFVPVSIRFNTAEAEVTFASLAARLAEVYGEPLGWAARSSQQWRGICLKYLARTPPDGKKLVVIMDGLDEAADWRAGPDLFPLDPPENVRVVASARYLAGDIDDQGWLERLKWKTRSLARSIPLPALSRTGVTEVLAAMGHPLDSLASQVDVTGELFRLSQGDPLLVRLYVEALLPYGDRAAVIIPQDLPTIEEGLEGYFGRWWEDQQEQWRSQKRDPLAEKEDLLQFLNLCASALGPLAREDVANLAGGNLSSGIRIKTIASDVQRFVIGDGQKMGFVFSHPRLGQYFWDEMLPQERQHWEARFLDYGHVTLTSLNDGTLAPERAPTYAVRYYGAHLQRAGSPPEAYWELVSEGWLRAWYALDGMYAGFLNDIDRAWRAAEEDTEQLEAPGISGKALAMQFRCALCYASVAALSAGIPIELLVLAIETGVLTPLQVFMLVRSIPDNRARSDALAAISPGMPDWLLDEILGATEHFESETTRGWILGKLAPYLPQVLLRTALEMAKGFQRPRARTLALGGIVARLEEPLLGETMHFALNSVGEIEPERERRRALRDMIGGLAPEDQTYIAEVRNLIRQFHDSELRNELLSDLEQQITIESQLAGGPESQAATSASNLQAMQLLAMADSILLHPDQARAGKITFILQGLITLGNGAAYREVLATLAPALSIKQTELAVQVVLGRGSLWLAPGLEFQHRFHWLMLNEWQSLVMKLQSFLRLVLPSQIREVFAPLWLTQISIDDLVSELLSTGLSRQHLPATGGAEFRAEVVRILRDKAGAQAVKQLSWRARSNFSQLLYNLISEARNELLADLLRMVNYPLTDTLPFNIPYPEVSEDPLSPVLEQYLKEGAWQTNPTEIAARLATLLTPELEDQVTADQLTNLANHLANQIMQSVSVLEYDIRELILTSFAQSWLKRISLDALITSLVEKTGPDLGAVTGERLPEAIHAALAANIGKQHAAKVTVRHCQELATRIRQIVASSFSEYEPPYFDSYQYDPYWRDITFYDDLVSEPAASLSMDLVDMDFAMPARHRQASQPPEWLQGLNLDVFMSSLLENSHADLEAISIETLEAEVCKILGRETGFTPPGELCQHAARFLKEAFQAISLDFSRLDALGFLLPRLNQRAKETILANISRRFEAQVRNSSFSGADLPAILPPDVTQVLRGSIRQLVREAADMPETAEKTALLWGLAELPNSLVPDRERERLVHEALLAAQAISDASEIILFNAELSQHLAENLQESAMAQILSQVELVPDPFTRLSLLENLTPQLSESGANTARRMVHDLRAVLGAEREIGFLIDLLPVMSAAQQDEVARYILDLVNSPSENLGWYSLNLDQLAPYIPPDRIQETLESVKSVYHDNYLQFLTKLQHKNPATLTQSNLETALQTALENTGSAGTVVQIVNSAQGDVQARLVEQVWSHAWWDHQLHLEAQVLVGVFRLTPEPARRERLPQLLAKIEALEPGTQAGFYQKLARAIPEDMLPLVLASARKIADPNRVWALSALLPRLAAPERADCLDDIRATLPQLDASAATVIFRRIAPELDEPDLLACLDAILESVQHAYFSEQAKALRDLAAHLPESRRDKAIAIARAIPDEQAKIRALIALGLSTGSEQREEILGWAFEATRLDDPQDSAEALATLVSNLPDDTWKQKGLERAFQLEDEALRLELIGKIASKLHDPQKREAMRAAYDLAQDIPERKRRERALLTLLPQFPPTTDLMKNGLRSVQQMHNPQRAQGLKALTPRLSTWSGLEPGIAFALWQESLREFSQHPRPVFIEEMEILLPFTMAFVRANEKEQAIQTIRQSLQDVRHWWP